MVQDIGGGCLEPVSGVELLLTRAARRLDLSAPTAAAGVLLLPRPLSLASTVLDTVIAAIPTTPATNLRPTAQTTLSIIFATLLASLKE